MLTAAQKTLVQDTFAIITPIADDAAALFYQRLFKLDPSLERKPDTTYDTELKKGSSPAFR